MSRFQSRIAANSELLARFTAQKLDILGARYEFMNRSEIPYVRLIDATVGSALIFVASPQIPNQVGILGGIKLE